MAENTFISFELSAEDATLDTKLFIVNSANITQIIVSDDIRLYLVDGSSSCVPITKFNCSLLGIDYSKVSQ